MAAMWTPVLSALMCWFLVLTLLCRGAVAIRRTVKHDTPGFVVPDESESSETGQVHSSRPLRRDSSDLATSADKDARKWNLEGHPLDSKLQQREPAGDFLRDLAELSAAITDEIFENNQLQPLTRDLRVRPDPGRRLIYVGELKGRRASVTGTVDKEEETVVDTTAAGPTNIAKQRADLSAHNETS